MNLGKLCDCRAPMAARCFPMDDRRGRDVMVAIAKLTYAVGPGGAVSLADPPSPIRTADAPVSDRPNASIRYPSDLFDDKPGTDVLLLGTAYPPADRQVTEQAVSVRIAARHGTIEKALKVYGARVWHKGLVGVVPGPAAPLAPTPLVYELTYGGRDESDPRGTVVERRNLAGSGHVADRSRLVGLPAPPIEDPRAPLSSRSPAPAGFGPISAWWEPRASRAGSADEAWKRDRAPLRPVDFDPRFYAGASPGLWSETPLVGDEPVEVLGATPSGALRFRLPAFGPRFHAVIRGESIPLPTHLDTYLIDADLGRVELTWRAAVPMPRRAAALESMQVFADGELPEPMIEQALRAGERAGESEALP